MSKPTKIGVIRLTEADKAADTINYVVKSKKHVYSTSPTGENLEKSSKNSKNFTEIERLILIIETLQEEIDFSDEEIKKALSKLDDKILPKSFPTRWGGKHKI